jgi:hypothetical protein
MKSFGPKKIQITCRDSKVPFLQLFRRGRDDRTLGPSRIPHRISKIILALGSYDFLAMLEGKIGVTPFFLGLIW